MTKTIHAVYSQISFGHYDCVMLVNAEDCNHAKNRAIEETSIVDEINEHNIVAEDLGLIDPNENYIKIFADDISYKF